MTVQFSVIIPARNEERNIGRCLDSIFRVDWDRSAYEVIVVDNGSTDRTAEIARQKGAAVYLQPGLTISGLRNFGAARARGEILAFMDADCGVAPSWLSEAAKYLSRGDIVCFGSPPRVPAAATWVQRAWYQVRRKRTAVGETEWLESMNMFIRRDAFRRCNGFDETLMTCEDYDISLRLKSLGKIFTDADVEAVHYGEAADVVQFFRKERWRGISNLAGAFRHGLNPGELPSLLLPLLHCLVLMALAASPGLAWLTGRTALPFAAAVLFVVWQMLLFLLSFKRYYRGMLSQVVQVFVLLNVYYVARGAAMLR